MMILPRLDITEMNRNTRLYIININLQILNIQPTHDSKNVLTASAFQVVSTSVGSAHPRRAV